MSPTSMYAKPRSMEDARVLLAGLGPGVAMIAGGQEVMPSINHGLLSPSVLVDLNGLTDLRGIHLEGTLLVVGALCTHREIETDELVRRHVPLLAHALAQVGGGWQVRNRGTIGGNIVSMHPLYDTLPALLVLRASVRIQKADAFDDEPLSALIANTAHGLGSSAILVRVQIPTPERRSGWGYHKLKGTHGAYSSATAACVVEADSSGRLADVRLVIGAVESLPRDVTAVLGELRGARFDSKLGAEVEQLCARSIRVPLDDQRGHSEYRRAMAGVCGRRAFQAAADSAKATATR